MKIKTRISITNLILFIAVISIIGGITYSIEKNILLQEAKQQSEAIISGLMAQQKTAFDSLQVTKEAFNKANIMMTKDLAKRLVNDTSLLNIQSLATLCKEYGVDEIAIIGADGKVQVNSHGKSIGWDLHSSEQAVPFLEGISNKNFALAQDPAIRGADNILFQYIGVARLDQPGVVQIGLQPKKYEELVQKFEVNQLLQNTKIPIEGGYISYFDLTGKITAHNKPGHIGKNEFTLNPKLKQIAEKETDKLIQTERSNSSGVIVISFIKKTGDHYFMVSIPKASLFAPLNFQLIVLILSIFLGSILGFLIFDRLLKIFLQHPIEKLSKEVTILAQGDFTQDLTKYATRSDELGVLGGALNHMVISLRELIKIASQNTQGVASASEQLSATSQEVGSGAQQMAATVSEMARGTQEQRINVEDTQDSIEEMNKNIKEANDSIQEMVKDVDGVVQSVSIGKSSIESAKKQINYIAESAAKTADSIKKLDNHSEHIGQIISLITGIAEQTNLLALNAAIEAARAGEQGRGFAVVADEVRKLAEQSRNAAGNISSLIKEIQDETKNTVQIVSISEQEVSSGILTLESSVESFENIEQSIQKMTKKIKTVAESSNKISLSSLDAANSITDIMSVIEESAAGAEEVAAAAEEQSASVEQLTSSAFELATLADNLKTAVEKFKF
jgi:methyl-accepting chemotaxis protein